jgi:hypothetical protein
MSGVYASEAGEPDAPRVHPDPLRGARSTFQFITAFMPAGSLAFADSPLFLLFPPTQFSALL